MGPQMAPLQTIDRGVHPTAASREGRPIPFRSDNHERDSEERGRSRKRRRSGDDRANGNHDEGNNSGTAEGSPAGGTPRKRRRSRKGLDKKFECPHEDCGKSYSRAEHLYRHQLNREPFAIPSFGSQALIEMQIPPSRFTTVIFLTVTDLSYAKIFVPGIVTGTQLEAHNCRERTCSPKMPCRHR